MVPEEQQAGQMLPFLREQQRTGTEVTEGEIPLRDTGGIQAGSVS